MRSFTPVSLNWDNKHYDLAVLSIDLGQGWRSLFRIIVFFGEGFTVHVFWNWNWSVQVPVLATIKAALTRVWYFLKWVGARVEIIWFKIGMGLSTICQRIWRCFRKLRIRWKRAWLHLELESKNNPSNRDPYTFMKDFFPMIIFGVLLLGYMSIPARAWAPTMVVRIDAITIEELRAGYVRPEPKLPPELQAVLDAREAKRQHWLDYLQAQDEQLSRIPRQFRTYIAMMTYEHGVPVEIVVNLIERESEWYAKARSRPNANGSLDEGMMQLNTLSQPYLIEHYYTGSQEFDVFNAQHNIEVGIGFLAGLYREFGNWTQAVMAYNCGSYRVHKNEVPASTLVYVEIILGDDLNRI